MPLGSLRVFVAVAQHLSFTRAADALGVTASAVSVQVRTLEEYLARPLFRRNGREVHVTAEGRALLPRVQQALEQLERAIDDARTDRYGGTLKLSTLASYMQQWLLPRLGRFRAKHGDVDLHLHSSGDIVDFMREEFQLAIRFGNGPWPNVQAEKLMDEWVLPVCSPALFERHGPLRSVDDLRRYPLLHSVSEPWTIWLFDGRASDQASAVRGSMFDDSHALVAWPCREPDSRWLAGAWSRTKSPMARWSEPAPKPFHGIEATGWYIRHGRQNCLPSTLSVTGSRLSRRHSNLRPAHLSDSRPMAAPAR